MSNIVFVTGNKNKLAEVQAYLDLSIIGLDIEIGHEIQSESVLEVSIDKAHKAFAAVQKPVLVEDTSVIFDALDSMPGPFIKWFLQQENSLEMLVRMLSDFSNRSAKAEVCFSYHDGKQVHSFLGEVDGVIANKPQGKSFGWDPIFIPDGQTLTFGQMSPAEKVRLSPRSKALDKLNTYLAAG